MFRFFGGLFLVLEHVWYCGIDGAPDWLTTEEGERERESEKWEFDTQTVERLNGETEEEN